MTSLEQALKLLPISLTKDPVVIAMYEAVAIQLQEAYEEAHAVVDIVNVDKLPELMLDLIAYEKHVDFYDDELSLMQKRELIKSSVSWHRKKGTRQSVEQLLKVFFNKVYIDEWFEYGGKPYFFKIEASTEEFSSNSKVRLLRMVESTKNLRSKLEFFAWVFEDVDIHLIDNTYHYPVIFPRTGEMVFEILDSVLAKSDITLQDNTYHYPVEFDVYELHGDLFKDTLNLTDETYNYTVVFPRTGEMEPIGADTTNITLNQSVEKEAYSYKVHYPITGEAVTGEEWFDQ